MSRRVATVTDAVRNHLPSVIIEIVNVETLREPMPDGVFCVPTYLLNGRVISLGNPDDHFVNELRALVNDEDTCRIA
jgi:hypothetical protein